jgi:crotonobetainyl-CoA:carnitine CoA-transferase CaiB-like acyl-CoA transferase
MNKPLQGSKPLQGLRVLELARVLAGPWCGQLLADMGADVVKVERPGEGDDTRAWGPPFVEGPAGENYSAAYFHSCNRGKRSITVDYATPHGAALIVKLAHNADIVLENFKVGGLKKYGLDYASLKAVNPKLIYCSVTGFGQDGPYAPRAGYDYMIQGMGGIMSLTGEPEGEPMKMAVGYVDIFTGMYATTAVLAALRRRDATGEGAHIDMALLDTQAGLLQNAGMGYLVDGKEPKRYGNAHANIVPYQAMPTRDGHFILASGNDGQYAKFCQIIGCPELINDQRFASNELRVANRAMLMPLLMEQTKTFAKADLLERLAAAGVPAGPINTVPEVFADPHIIHRKVVRSLPAPYAKGGSIPAMGCPIVMDGTRLTADRPSPRLGEHQDEVLSDPHWGFTSRTGG